MGFPSDQTAIFIAGIYNVNEGRTILPVYINSNGQLGTQAPSSSRRFKKEIKSMDKTSEAVLSLKPVTLQYKSDKTGTRQFGLIAEEVSAVNPDLVVRDVDGQIYTVRYDGERDIAQRVSQRAQHCAGAGSSHCRVTERNGSPRSNRERAGSANPESERPN
jgi:hypothetical protein